ncbi:MAG: hypothetical protein JWR02_2093 [Mucilaginibacter sp.]|nr:hypothetical protein [Mucilaginibacter sp.]
MNIPNFKLTFQTSQITSFATPIVVGRILTKLQNKKYQICSTTDNSITFRWNPFRLLWNFQAPYVLDGGVVEITKLEKETIVVLNYYINTLYSLLVFTALITGIIIQGDYIAILFFGILFLTAGVYQYYTTKRVGKELLNYILTENY